MQPMNPRVRAFFNMTAGLEKFINAILAALAVYVATIEALTPEQRALIVAIIGAVQMLYTTNTTPEPPAP